MDFLNKDKLTHIIIFIFILLSVTYLYNMNSNTISSTINPNTNSKLNLNTNKINTITENFMIISEDQDLQANNVMINNLTQVSFKACGRDENNTNKIVSADPTINWENGPLTLQDVFDTKLNNSGVIGTVVPGNIPLQGIILSDAAENIVVKLGTNIPFGVATSATSISDRSIQFGGPNNGRHSTSGSIFVTGTGATPFPDDSLCIVGKMDATNDFNLNNSKISMLAAGGFTVNGPTNISGMLTSYSSLNSSIGANQGGQLSLLNPTKTNITGLADTWKIVNIKEYGTAPLKYLNGLHFWKTGRDIAAAENSQFALYDNGNSFFNGPVTIRGNSPLNHLLPEGNKWYQNNGTGSLIVCCKTIDPSLGSLKIETVEWTGTLPNGNVVRKPDGGIPTETYSSIVCKGRLHMVCTEQIYIGAKAGVTIGKHDPEGWTGVLNVDNRIDIANKVRLGTTNPQAPNALTCISDRGIQFGGANDGRQVDSAQISVGLHTPDTLAIVGMSTGTDAQTRKIGMWAEGGCNIYGTLSVNRNLNVSGSAWMGSRLHLTESSDVGASICLINPAKGSNNQIVNNWTIFNMTGSYTNALKFWRYGGGLESGVAFNNIGPAFTMHDNGDATCAREFRCTKLYTGNIEVDWSIVAQGPIKGQGSWLTSDIRLKENIKNISKTDKDKVLQLVAKTYNWITDEKKSKRIGFIAQEVEELYPEFVSEDDKGEKSLNYIELIPLLLEQIKELKKSIPSPETVNTNVLNIGGVTLTADELYKLKQLLNNY